MDDLVKRLRRGAEYHEAEGDMGLPAILRDAADRIEELTEEVELLRNEVRF